MPLPAGLGRIALLLVVLACTLAAVPTEAVAAESRVLIALLPADVEQPPPGAVRPTVAALIDGHPELALGMVSATQSGYSPEQALLDLTAGTRTSRGTYDPSDPPDMSLLALEDGSGLVVNWVAAVARAESAPADIVPGLLASSIPGGAAYAGIDGQTNAEALVAATRDGAVGAISLGR